MRAPLLLIAGSVLSSAAMADQPPVATHAHSHTHAGPEIDETQGPVMLEATYTGEVIANAAGGLRRGTRYLDNFDLVLEADLGRVIGWRGAELHVYGLYNNGTAFSELVDDAQAPSNIETGTRAVRLYEAWINQQITPAISLKAGLYDLNSEFDALEASGLFTASAYGIGTDISQTGLAGPSIFPSTSLAARLQVRPAEGWAIRAAVLDGVPGDPNRPGRTTISLGGDDGALLIGELEAPVAGGRVLLGHWRYTEAFDTHDGNREHGNAGVYLRGDAPLLNRDGKRIDGFFRLGTASGRFNTFDRFASAGAKFTGWIPGREDDEFGLAVAGAFTSPGYRLLSGAGNSEIAVEATWRAPVARWLSLQPSMQYVRNPSADPTIPDALILGLRAEITFRLID